MRLKRGKAREDDYRIVLEPRWMGIGEASNFKALRVFAPDGTKIYENDDSMTYWYPRLVLMPFAKNAIRRHKRHRDSSGPRSMEWRA
jgi:hypothetical protein